VNFPLSELGYRFRGLKKGVKGWDVVALQKGLLLLGYRLPRFGADGDFGGETDEAVATFQKANRLVVDGIAGIATQRQVGKKVIKLLAGGNPLIEEMATGQVEAECGWQLGNYTPPYPNGHRDLGPVQLNLDPTPENLLKAFDPARIGDLIARYLKKHDEYYLKAGARTERQAWSLAAGSWNAPAWSDTLARGGTLRPEQVAHLSAYVARVTVYVDWDAI
jgi:peptidoglycan hydrolase-like protein with peptidoglycan-binding domain